MIHPDDEQTLQRILRCSTLPRNVVEECERWTRSYHGAGHSGPIGTLALICMVRAIGLSLPEVEKPPEAPATWVGVPLDSPIEAMFFGGWMPARFKGLSASGMVSICLQDEEIVREVRPHVVRKLGEVCDKVSQPEPKTDAKPTMAEALKALVANPESPEPSKAEATGAIGEEKADEKPPEPKPESLHDKTWDWLKVGRGDAVWVTDGECARDAIFDKVGKSSKKKGVETLYVKFAGETELQEIPAAGVILAD